MVSSQLLQRQTELTGVGICSCVEMSSSNESDTDDEKMLL